MQKLNGKDSARLTFLCAASYFVSYLTRINFGVVLAEIIASGAIAKTAAGAVTTIGFITYGVGQPISGWLGDRINPKKLMFLGFITTAAMNFLIPFCPNAAAMCAVWGVNGFAQSLMWPPMVKIMKTAMDNDSYNKGCVAVTWGSTAATIVLYLVSPLIISFLGWKYVFFTVCVIAAVMSAVWYTKITSIEKSTGLSYPVKSAVKRAKRSFSITPALLITVMLAIFLQGCLRDGVTTWMPTYVSEVFSLGSEISILSGVVIPLFTLASVQIISVIYKRTGKKPFKCAAVLFVIAAASCALLTAFPDSSAVTTVILASLVAAVMHGINLILVCFLPGMYADEENVSSLSGILNFMTYVGSAASTYGFAVISESYGWSSTVVSWLVIASLGAAMCFACVIRSKRAT